VTKVDDHRSALRLLQDWMPYLAAHSGLPGPRGNLALVAACGEEADVGRAEQLLATGDEFASLCGLVALGRCFGQGDDRHMGPLHRYAADERWRVREGVAMAIQRAYDDDPERGFALAEGWVTDPDPLVQRSAVAAVCEPRLLRDPVFARRALAIVDGASRDLAGLTVAERRSSSVRTLRQALGYGWSVAVAALPEEGLPLFEQLGAVVDPDMAWIVKENGKKARLRRVLSTAEAKPGARPT